MKKLLFTCIITCLHLAIVNSQPIVYDWAKSMGGKGNYDGSIGLAKDSNGDIYITGEFSGTRDFGSYSLTSLGFSDVFVAKYSAAGNCLWAVRGGANFSSAYAGKLEVVGNTVYVTGNFTSLLDFNGLVVSSSGSKDIFVGGFDASNGTCLWLDKAGSSFDDIPYSMEPANGGGFYICGTFTGTATFGTITVSSSSIIDYDIFLAKYDAAGTCIWVSRIGDTGADKAFAMKQLPGGGILVTGSYEGTVNFGAGFTFTSEGFSDMFLAKFDGSGNVLWAFSGGSDNNDVGYGVDADPTGNIYVTGFIADTATFGTININNPGNINVFLTKFSFTGYPLWVRMGGNINDDIGFDVVTDAGGSCYVTGYVNGNGYFGTTPINGVNAHDVFVAKYDNAGAVRWLTKIGGINFDRGKTLMLDVNGYCYVAGDFADAATLGSTTLTTQGGTTGIFLTHMGGGTLGIGENSRFPVSIYPNPVSDLLLMDLSSVKDEAFTLSLFNSNGSLVYAQTLGTADARSNFSLPVNHLASGNYLLKLETSAGDFSTPLVKQ